MKLSIIIPTHYYSKREGNVFRLLGSLEDGVSREKDIEILVINNGKKTIELSKLNSSFSADFLSKVKFINESKVGLSNARNVGISEAKGYYISFLDDDVYVIKNFIEILLTAFSSSNALCVGGSVILENNYKSPYWLTPYFSRFIVPPEFPDALTVKCNPYYIIGANMAFKADVFPKYGLFDLDLSRVKRGLITGEDTEMILRLPQEKVFIEPNAKVFTQINPERLKFGYFMRRLYWQGVSDGIMLRKNPQIQLYDIKELKIKEGFLAFLGRKILHFKLRESFCAVLRYLGCNIRSTMLK